MKKAAAAARILALARLSFGDDSARLLSIDHYVRVKSTVSAIVGQDVPIYVRERVQAGSALLGGTSDRAALFVHAAGTPAKASDPHALTTIALRQHDKQVSPDRVRELDADLAAPEKLLVDLACSSHNAMWEENRLLMFKASLDWLTTGSVNGMKEGTLRLGY